MLNAAKRVTLLHFLESDETLQMTASAPREKSYVTVESSKYKEEDITKLKQIAIATFFAIVNNRTGIPNPKATKPILDWFDEWSKEGITEIKLNESGEAPYTEVRKPNAACQSR